MLDTVDKTSSEILMELGVLTPNLQLTGLKLDYKYTTDTGTNYRNMDYVNALCLRVVRHFAPPNYSIASKSNTFDAMVGVDSNVALARQAARAYNGSSLGKEVMAIWSKKDKNGEHVWSGFTHVFSWDYRVLIVTDTIDDIEPIRELIAAIKAADGVIIGVGAFVCNVPIVDDKIDDVPVFALVNIS